VFLLLGCKPRNPPTVFPLFCLWRVPLVVVVCSLLVVPLALSGIRRVQQALLQFASCSQYPGVLVVSEVQAPGGGRDDNAGGAVHRASLERWLSAALLDHPSVTCLKSVCFCVCMCVCVSGSTVPACQLPCSMAGALLSVPVLRWAVVMCGVVVCGVVARIVAWTVSTQ
jgi:hypothetical protein